MPSTRPAPFSLPAPLRRGLGGLLALALLWLTWLAASPSAHHGLHEDCDAPDHQCAVTHWSQGQGLEWSEPVIDLAPSWTCDRVVVQPRRVVGMAVCSWHWAQGPPVGTLAS